MTIEEKYIAHVEECFAKADRNESKLIQEVHDIQGMTGTKTRHLYNNLLNMEDVRFLEIGCWAGSSSSAFMYGNTAKCFFIENFAGFGGPKEECLNNLKRFRGNNYVEFFEKDCFQIDLDIFENKFNIYSYDADHSSNSHYLALKLYVDAMEDVFIYIVDDYNFAEVRQGTQRAIDELGLTTVWKKEIRLTNDDQFTHDQEEAKNTYWNGVAVFIFKKQK